MRRWHSSFLALLLILAGTVVPMAKQDVSVWLFYNGVWNEHTDNRVYTRYPITINAAAGDEQSGLAPSSAELTFGNRDNVMNPENRKSPLFGLIGRNTPIRIDLGQETRFSGQVVSWKPRRAVKGDAWVHVKAQNTIQRLGQGTPPVLSSLYRTMTNAGLGTIAPTEYWPLEDGSQATQFASAVGGSAGLGGISAGGTEAPTPAGHSGIIGSSTSVLMPEFSFIRAQVRSYTDDGFWAIQGAFIFDELDSEQIVVATLGNGRLVQAGISGAGGSPQNFFALVLDPSLGVVFTDNVNITGDDLLSEPVSMMFAVTDTGGGDDFVARILDGGGQIRAEITTTDVGYSTVSQIEIQAAGVPSGASHIGFYANPLFDADLDAVAIARAASGFDGETAGERFDRLCIEEGIADTVVGVLSDTQPMGPQYPDTSLNWFEEIARTDGGVIYDTRDELGLTFRTGRSRYNQ